MKSLTLRGLFVVLGVVVCVTVGAADDRTMRQASLKKLVAEIDMLLEPFKQKSVREGRGGRIFPFDLPFETYIWYLQGTNRSQSFVRKMRVLLRAGVCHGESTALRKVFELEWLIYGFGFNEIEVVFLQRYSTLRELDLPFHHRYRQRKNYTSNISEEPQLIRRINSAFEKRDAAKALEFVPSFRKLC